ncbi:hypothetical protein N7481_011063 [Penicillium waksmanii]|uniref:uncharacterized protein n=1 Tax=Penicillium waksmanii TaxID=69791 RepID=UPI002548C866|nr:uncharacterized protein N7481_011063 [Penicillium waksmanii]KAJ5973853.1 hypothetical protein N7481_011063 [Penicillium waksmanii]
MESPKSASMWKKIQTKLGLNIPILLLMFKYQSDAVARQFSTIGYLIPIMSILTIPVAPRARFFQNLIVSTLSVGFAVALSFLSMWCAVRARANTTHIPQGANSAGPVAGAHVSPYNAAASVNMAIWLAFEVWLANTYVSAAVNVLIIPLTSRKLVSMHMMANFDAIQRTLDAQREFAQALCSRDWGFVHGDPDASQQEQSPSWPEANTLKSATMETTRTLGRITSELRYAKREVDWDYLGPKDLANITRLLKKVLASMVWMESLVEVSRRIPRLVSEMANISREEEQQKLCWVFEQRRRPTEQLIQAMKEGLDHSVHILRLGKARAVSESDIEANRDHASSHLEDMIERFLQGREDPLGTWLSWTGIDQSSETPTGVNSQQRERYQFQLFFLLDMESSLISTARRILDLIKYAGSKVDDGTMGKKRLVHPTWKLIKKWFWAALSREDQELDYYQYSRRSGTVRIYLNDVIQTGTDPEHLLPKSTWEKIGDNFRRGYHFFGSPESVFGFRVAVATMTVSLVAFLRNSQHFYIQQRLIWGSIMIAISMASTVGSAMYGQSMRLLATFIGMVLSYIDWYIVDQQPAGVLVFVGITMFLSHYPLIRFPAHAVPPIVEMVTVMLIVGYALQVKKVGVTVSESNEQEYHALYVLSPYRLATVVGGIGVAFIFTYFPSAATVKSCFRRDLATFLYLLAHYYSSVYTTNSLVVRGLAGDYSDKKSLGRVLEKARTRVLAKEIVLLQAMEEHKWFFRWEPTTGGKFPRDAYDKLAEHARNILQFSATLIEIADSFHLTGSMSSEPWVEDIRRLITSLDLSSHEVTYLLTTLSGAIKTGSPLPLYLKAPKIRLPTELLAAAAPDASIFKVENFSQPAFSAIASMEITMMALEEDLSQLLSGTKHIVGELNLLTDIVRRKDLPANMDSIMGMDKRD